jgi:hypothetical protein
MIWLSVKREGFMQDFPYFLIKKILLLKAFNFRRITPVMQEGSIPLQGNTVTRAGYLA